MTHPVAPTENCECCVPLQGADLKVKQNQFLNFSTSAHHKEMNYGLKETSNLCY